MSFPEFSPKDENEVSVPDTTTTDEPLPVRLTVCDFLMHNPYTAKKVTSAEAHSMYTDNSYEAAWLSYELLAAAQHLATHPDENPDERHIIAITENSIYADAIVPIAMGRECTIHVDASKQVETLQAIRATRTQAKTTGILTDISLGVKNEFTTVLLSPGLGTAMGKAEALKDTISKASALGHFTRPRALLLKIRASLKDSVTDHITKVCEYSPGTDFFVTAHDDGREYVGMILLPQLNAGLRAMEMINNDRLMRSGPSKRTDNSALHLDEENTDAPRDIWLLREALIAMHCRLPIGTDDDGNDAYETQIVYVRPSVKKKAEDGGGAEESGAPNHSIVADIASKYTGAGDDITITSADKIVDIAMNPNKDSRGRNKQLTIIAEIPRNTDTLTESTFTNKITESFNDPRLPLNTPAARAIILGRKNVRPRRAPLLAISDHSRIARLYEVTAVVDRGPHQDVMRTEATRHSP